MGTDIYAYSKSGFKKIVAFGLVFCALLIIVKMFIIIKKVINYDRTSIENIGSNGQTDWNKFSLKIETDQYSIDSIFLNKSEAHYLEVYIDPASKEVYLITWFFWIKTFQEVLILIIMILMFIQFYKQRMKGPEEARWPWDSFNY